MCVQLLYNDVVVWKQFCEPYPVSIYFRSYDSYDSTYCAILYLNFDPYYYTYVYDGNMWILRKDLSHCYSFKLDPSMHPKDITIVTESGGSEESSSSAKEESAATAAGYTVYDHGDGIYLYDFGTARCSEVMYRGQTVSKRQSGGPYPRRIVFDTESLTFEFDFKNKTAVYKLNAGGWYISEVSDNLEHFKYEFPEWILKQTYHRFGSKLSMKNLKILTSDETDGSGAKPINVHSSMLLYEKWQFGYYYPVHTLYLELRYKNQVLFKSTEYPYRGRPRIVLFDENNNNIWVFFSSGFSFSLNYIDHSDETVLKAEPANHTEPVEFKTERKTDAPSISPEVANYESTPKSKPTITKISLDINTTESTDDYDFNDENGVITYTAKSGCLFSKVTQGNKDIWKSKNNVFANLARSKSKDDGIYLAILLTNNMFKLFKQEGDGNWTDITSQRSDVTNLKFLDDNDTELKASDYTITIIYLSYEYTFKPGVKCRKIRYNNIPIWNHSDDTRFSKIKIFSMGLITNSFFVFNNEFESKKLEFKPTPEKSEPEPTTTVTILEAPEAEAEVETPETETKPAETPQETPRTAPETTPPETTPTTTPDATATEPATTPVITPETTPLPPKSKDSREEVSITLLNLDIDQKKDGKGFYFCANDKIGTFTANFGYGFNVVTQKGNEIWKTNDNENYGTKIVIDGVSICGTTKNIDIFLVKGVMKQFNRSGKNKPWMEKSKIITLDLKNIEKKIEYNRIVEDIFTTITTNYPFLIDKIVNPKTFFSKCCGSICVSKCCDSNCRGSECCGTNKFIWESKIIIGSDSKVIEKHANKVIFANPSNNMRYLAILLTTDEIVLLHNSCVRKCWEDITGTRNSISDLKAINEDNTELDSSQYKLELNKFSYGIKFNYRVKCSKILYKDKVIYNYDGNKDFEFLRGIYLYLSSNRFYIVGRENVTKLLGEENDLITLDVKKKQSTIEYQFVEKTNYGSFVCRDSFFFNKITYNDKLVWESGSDKDYSYKVVLDSGSGSSSLKNITLHLVSGNVVYFYNTSNLCQGAKWSEKYKTVSLNIDRTSSGTEFDYKGEEGKNIFSAKSGYVFYKIIDSEMIFWDSRSHFDFANKVVSYGTGSKKDKVLLFHENNTVTNFYKADKWYSVIGVTLDISLSKDGNSFFYAEDYKLNVEVYYPEDKRAFFKVIQSKTFESDKIIWEAENPEEYATKVLTDGCGKSSKNRVTIHMSNGEIKHFYSGGMRKPWLETSGKIILDIKKKKSTIEIDYVEGFFKTFTPKPGYQFKTVMLGSSWTWLVCGSSCCKSACLGDHIFWEAQTDEEYATEVRIVPFKSSEYLIIFVNESKFVLFHKGGKDKTWNDITETRYDLANLKFYKKYNDSEFTVVDSGQYKITNKNTSYIYTFKCDAECDLIQYMDKTLYIFKPDFGYPSKIYFDIYRNSFHAFFSEDACHRLYLGEEIEAISLDIGIKNSTDEFDYVQTEEVERYIPKVGFMFNSLFEKRTGYYYTDCCKFDCCGGEGCESDCCECECECCDSDCFSSDCCDYECFESGLCSCKCCYCQCCDFDCCGSSCCATKCFSFGCRRSVNQVIWKTEDPLEYCSKVIIDSSEEDEQTLTVIKPDGFKQVFTRSLKTEPWEETTENKRIIETSESEQQDD
ncbi:SfiI-subtelomeric fragment related protein family member, putative [Theileria annulata]|uniref:SfiI-subtelomeric related protein family member, putative n=1 Tax=Theileria annulata TaxID=5874 RepID=Q4UHH6_THEAN|nr:SfiI-subtelomeric fragment related protein family member, putative [Theileria annulata]CAI73463.1 SfiI-subtelomeric fragment related protein family member, putative [Theileria annulata]